LRQWQPPGTHSTGKSTFLARLAHVLRREGIEVATVADLAEQAHRTGLPILHAHNYTSTLWIITRGISEELAAWPHADVLLVDRPVPNALGYSFAALAYRDEAQARTRGTASRNVQIWVVGRSPESGRVSGRVRTPRS
jgi:hypothetical protein